jgi:hypothetical protein
MTKDEAIRAMLDGEKVTHRYFMAHEWVTILDPIRNTYLFEDGVTIDAQIFWRNRRTDDWLIDWDIFEE